MVLVRNAGLFVINWGLGNYIKQKLAHFEFFPLFTYFMTDEAWTINSEA